MGKKKEQLIKEYLEKPLVVGDSIAVEGQFLKSNVSRDPKYLNPVVIQKIYDNGTVDVKRAGYKEGEYRGEITNLNLNEVVWEKVTSRIGADPIPEKNWMSCCRETGFGFSNILFYAKQRVFGSKDDLGRIEYNFDPFVLNADKKELKFQRDLCWTLEDEQSFIDSIYNGLNLGTIVLRKHSYEYMKEREKYNDGSAADFDVIDGKQRLNTLERFLTDKFTDSFGNYWSDLSDYAQRRFGRYCSMNVLHIEEDATDEEVLAVFLNVNYTGRPMSKEHIEYVRSLYNEVKK